MHLGELIDYYTYQMKANKAKLDYLIKEIKEKEISLDIVEELKLRIVQKTVIYVQNKT